MSFGEKLYFLRLDKHLSQQELADMLGVHRKIVDKWEIDNNYPNIEQLKKLTEIFGVSIDYFTDELQSTDIYKNIIIAQYRKQNILFKHLQQWIVLLLLGLLFLMGLIFYLIYNKTGTNHYIMNGCLIISGLLMIYHYIINYKIKNINTLFDYSAPSYKHTRWIDFISYYSLSLVFTFLISSYLTDNIMSIHSPLIFEEFGYGYLQLALYGLLPILYTFFVIAKIFINKSEYTEAWFKYFTWILGFILLFSTLFVDGEIYKYPRYELIFMSALIISNSILIILLAISVNKRGKFDVNMTLLKIFIYGILLTGGNFINLIDIYPSGYEKIYIILSGIRILVALWILSSLIYQNKKFRPEKRINAFNVLSLINIVLILTFEILTLYYMYYNQVRTDHIYYFIYPANLYNMSFIVGLELIILIIISSSKKKDVY